MKVVRAFWTLSDKKTYKANAVYRTSVTEDSSVAAKAGVKYRMAFRRAHWAFSVEQCFFLVFSFLSLFFEYDFHNK